MKNIFQKWTVRYWTHYKNDHINDCFGNSVSWRGKARTQQEAIRKAEHQNKMDGIKVFRLHSAQLDEIPV